MEKIQSFLINMRVAGDNSVIISDGTQLNKGILKPNCSYVAGENNYIYKTDELGRQCGATACLQLKKHDKRKGNVGKPADKLPGDEAGHLFADMFGGSRFLDNLVAQSFNVNRSEYRKNGECLAKGTERRQIGLC